MGMYDEIEFGERVGQVKLWDCVMHTYREGDEIGPPFNGSYSIAMREGGFVHVEEGRIQAWTETPMAGKPVVDKYGAPYDENTGGLLGEGYLFDA
jgi:hypothetical protein